MSGISKIELVFFPSCFATFILAYNLGQRALRVEKTDDNSRLYHSLCGNGKRCPRTKEAKTIKFQFSVTLKRRIAANNFVNYGRANDLLN